MSEVKTVVVLSDGIIAHVGNWDYQYVDLLDENEEIIGQEVTNPLPSGAVEEKREVIFDGNMWHLAENYNPTYQPTAEQILNAKIETATLNLLIDLGVI